MNGGTDARRCSVERWNGRSLTLAERWNAAVRLVAFHRSTVPPFHRSTVRPFSRSTVPPFHRFPVPPFHRSTVPPFSRSTVPPFHRSTVHPFHRHNAPPPRLGHAVTPPESNATRDAWRRGVSGDAARHGHALDRHARLAQKPAVVARIPIAPRAQRYIALRY